MTGRLHAETRVITTAEPLQMQREMVLLGPVEGSVSWREGNALRPDQQDLEGIGFQTTYSFLS